MTTQVNTNIGELIAVFFAQFMDLYGDEDLASVATAAVINDLLSTEAEVQPRRVAA